MQEVNCFLKWLFDERLSEEFSKPDVVTTVESAQTFLALITKVISNASPHSIPTTMWTTNPFENPTKDMVCVKK